MADNTHYRSGLNASHSKGSPMSTPHEHFKHLRTLADEYCRITIIDELNRRDAIVSALSEFAFSAEPLAQSDDFWKALAALLASPKGASSLWEHDDFMLALVKCYQPHAGIAAYIDAWTDRALEMTLEMMGVEQESSDDI